GNLISGATSQYYQPIVDGNYSVLVTNTATGCSDMSDEYQFPSNLGLSDKSSNAFALYPNPADDQITITLPEGLKDHRYVITDVAGKEVARGELKKDGMTVPVKGLPTGMYYIVLNGEAGDLKSS